MTEQLLFPFHAVDCQVVQATPFYEEPPLIVDGQQIGFREAFFGVCTLAWWPHYGLTVDDDRYNKFLANDFQCLTGSPAALEGQGWSN